MGELRRAPPPKRSALRRRTLNSAMIIGTLLFLSPHVRHAPHSTNFSLSLWTTRRYVSAVFLAAAEPPSSHRVNPPAVSDSGAALDLAAAEQARLEAKEAAKVAKEAAKEAVKVAGEAAKAVEEKRIADRGHMLLGSNASTSRSGQPLTYIGGEAERYVDSQGNPDANPIEKIKVPGHGMLVLEKQFSAGMFGPVVHASLDGQKGYVVKRVFKDCEAAGRVWQPKGGADPYEDDPYKVQEGLRLNHPYEEVCILRDLTENYPQENIVKLFFTVETDDSMYIVLERAGIAIDLQKGSTYPGPVHMQPCGRFGSHAAP